MFSLICVWINGWLNNRKAGDWRRHRGHYDVSVMPIPSMLPHWNARKHHRVNERMDGRMEGRTLTKAMSPSDFVGGDDNEVSNNCKSISILRHIVGNQSLNPKYIWVAWPVFRGPASLWENKWPPWAHGKLSVTTVVTAPGPNDPGSVTARLGHSSVTARSQLSHG